MVLKRRLSPTQSRDVFGVKAKGVPLKVSFIRDTFPIGFKDVPHIAMKIISRSVKETMRIGKAIARKLRKGDIICLFGEFGSGKTVLAKGIAQGLGIRKEKVISPSFVLMRQHQGKLALCHFDLYRLKSPSEILALGYEEYFYGDCVTIIEWADRLKRLLPKESLKIELFFRTNTHRAMKFGASGTRYKELLAKIREDIRN